ncbi:pitrilysin family protein [Fulvivirgaceae bacterium BMA10]|uniref:Pitrilysin family protein n=1 Tax=Splendidivirga corallicola TaxID=3051826 RepID=A0ABT8KM62_9BACT|nr:pitrilysin family protein [Fulvivirgaceae bacterium BMA10]
MDYLERAIAPKFNEIKPFSLVEAKTTRLSNNVPLHLINAGDQPVVKIEILIKAGKWFESQDGTSFFTTKMLREGVSEKNSNEISVFLDQFGAFLELNPSADYCNISLYVLTKYLRDVLPLLSQIIFEPTFPEKELVVLKNIKKQSLKLDNEKNNIVGAKLFRKALFGGNHPYGKELKPEDIDLIDQKDLVKLHRKRFFKDVEIIVSGKVDGNDLKLLEEHFGSFNIKTEEESYIQFEPLSDDREVCIEKDGSLQSTIRIGKLLFKKNHPDYIKVLVVNEILGGYFGSRLMRNIREDKGYTYGIHSSIVSLRNEGYFVIGTDVKKDFTQATIDEIHKEINILRNELIGQEELDTVKNYMLGSFLSNVTTPFSLADKFKSIHFHGLTYDFYKDYFQTIKALSAMEILELSRKYLDIDSMTEVVVGGK